MARIVDAIGRVRGGALSCVEAAALLGLSERHFRRLRDGYLEGGAEANYNDKKDGDTNGEEQEADHYAANFLIPAEAIEQFLLKYGRVKDTYTAHVLEIFAKQIDIDPSLLLARLQKAGQGVSKNRSEAGVARRANRIL